MYKIMARYYSDPDQFGESYVITSDNSEHDTRLEIGSKVDIRPETELISIRIAMRTIARALSNLKIREDFIQDIRKFIDDRIDWFPTLKNDPELTTGFANQLLDVLFNKGVKTNA